MNKIKFAQTNLQFTFLVERYKILQLLMMKADTFYLTKGWSVLFHNCTEAISLIKKIWISKLFKLLKI